ncbi:MAG: aldehyde dehydrogenase family protein, partial [Candidatus Omnitrophica bacterium]|nr:aldehyde dehydrogenase family protein [Candidatus Omnitrophota bacterium]
ELFGPVAMIKSFVREGIYKIIQDYPYGLVMQIWTEDLKLAQDLAKLVNVGTVWINTFAQLSASTPFGGKGLSGWGRNLGKFGFFEYIQPKHIGIGKTRTPVEGWFGF